MAEEKYTARLLSDDIVEVVLKDHVYLDVSVTDAIDKSIQQLAPNRKLYQIVIASGPYIVNPEMRNAAVAGDSGIKQLAIAWVSPDERANEEQEKIVSKSNTPSKRLAAGRARDASRSDS